MIDHELQGQYEALDLENHRMRKAVAKLMARLTVWLDDDQFDEADGIMHPEFAPQCKPLATVPAAVDVGAAQAETAQAAARLVLFDTYAEPEMRTEDGEFVANFPANKLAIARKLVALWDAAQACCQCPACAPVLHASDCAVHNAPALPVGPCDCGAASGMLLLPREATKGMMVAAVKFANGPAVYKNVASAALDIEESIYGETWGAMVAAATANTPPQGDAHGTE